jgi:hypothetical protein
MALTIPVVCLLLAAVPHVEVVDEVYQLPPNDWRWVEISLNQRPAVVTAQYRALAGTPAIRAALVPRDELRKLRSSEGLDDYDPTPDAPTGQLRRHTREPGDYAVVIENRSAAPAAVRVRITLDFPTATTISSRRQLTVVAISFGVFFGIVGFSARRLLRALRPRSITPE